MLIRVLLLVERYMIVNSRTSDKFIASIVSSNVDPYIIFRQTYLVSNLNLDYYPRKLAHLCLKGSRNQTNRHA